eukprot:157201-Hanusia_phi.AAC.1
MICYACHLIKTDRDKTFTKENYRAVWEHILTLMKEQIPDVIKVVKGYRQDDQRFLLLHQEIELSSSD